MFLAVDHNHVHLHNETISFFLRNRHFHIPYSLFLSDTYDNVALISQMMKYVVICLTAWYQ